MPPRGTAITLIEALSEPDWQQYGLCRRRNADPKQFFPDATQRTFMQVRKVYAETRKEFCSKCPVRELCLEYAITNRIDDGMFGGETPTRRKAIRRYRTKLENGGEHPITAKSGCGRDENGQFVSGNKEQNWDKRRAL